jgi:hypothetical protein
LLFAKKLFWESRSFSEKRTAGGTIPRENYHAEFVLDLDASIT